MLHPTDDLYILKQTQRGLRISKPVFGSERILINNGGDFFFSSTTRHHGEIPVYVTETVPEQTVSLVNASNQCNAPLMDWFKLFAISMDFSGGHT